MPVGRKGHIFQVCLAVSLSSHSSRFKPLRPWTARTSSLPFPERTARSKNGRALRYVAPYYGDIGKLFLTDIAVITCFWQG
jgi:hypothetical protein